MNVNQIQSSIYWPVKEIDLILSNLILTNNEVKELDEINKKKKRIKKAESVFLKIEKRWVAELKHKEKELPILKIDQVEMANRLNFINNAFINELNKFYDNLKYSIIKIVQKDVLWSIIEEIMKELEMQKKKNDKWLKIALPELDIQEKVQKERRINLDKLVDDKKKKKKSMMFWFMQELYRKQIYVK